MGSSPLAVAHELLHGPDCPHSRSVVHGRRAVAMRTHTTGDCPGGKHTHLDFLLKDEHGGYIVDCPLEHGRAAGQPGRDDELLASEDDLPFHFSPPEDVAGDSFHLSPPGDVAGA